MSSVKSDIYRTGPKTVRATFKMSVGFWSRTTVDAEIARVRRCVIPIVGADQRMRPYLVGSAVALIYRGRKMLVTAEHVLSDNEHVPLSIFSSDGFSRPLQGCFVVDPTHDLAARLLSHDEAEMLQHVWFLPDVAIARVSAVGERFYGSVVGYPASAARRMDKITLDTQMESYSNFAWEGLDGKVSVAFDKKEGAVGSIGHVDPRDPFGKSGGAIFGLPVRGRDVVPQTSAKLVGISTRWKREMKSLQGASIAFLLLLLDEVSARSRHI